jgi:hypothetical protein
MQFRKYRLRVEDIAYVRAVLEGYDGVAVLEGEPNYGEIAWTVGDGLEDEADEIAAKLAIEVGMQPVFLRRS